MKSSHSTTQQTGYNGFGAVRDVFASTWIKDAGAASGGIYDAWFSCLFLAALEHPREVTFPASLEETDLGFWYTDMK